jgi:3-oxoacyl-[acyl-carrier-protein] synthase III
VISGAAAIAGIGATEFSKDSGRSELRLAAEATLAALADAGLAPSDVDGLVTFTMDSTAEIALARELGLSTCGSSATSGTAAAPRAAASSTRCWRSSAGSPRWWSATGR